LITCTYISSVGLMPCVCRAMASAASPCAHKILSTSAPPRYLMTESKCIASKTGGTSRKLRTHRSRGTWGTRPPSARAAQSVSTRAKACAAGRCADQPPNHRAVDMLAYCGSNHKRGRGHLSGRPQPREPHRRQHLRAAPRRPADPSAVCYITRTPHCRDTAALRCERCGLRR
jgi:hypothetical protein